MHCGVRVYKFHQFKILHMHFHYFKRIVHVIPNVQLKSILNKHSKPCMDDDFHNFFFSDGPNGGRRVISVAESFAIGGLASVISVSATAPLDRVRILLQCNHEINRSGRLLEPYRGVIDCTRRIFRTEGFLSFWRGNVIACVRYLPEQAIHFALKDAVAKVMNVSKNDSTAVRISKNLTAGALGGFSSQALLYSFDYCRTRLAADILHAGTDGKRQRQFKGIFEVYRKTLRSDGIVGLYRGFMVSCLGVVVYRGAYFGLYDTMRPVFLNYEGSTLILTGFLLGFVTTIVAGVISYPLDTIRRRMMMRSCEQVKYKGWIDCVRYVYRNEGLLSLYGGVSINIMKGFASLPILLFYDGFKTLFTRYRLEND